MKWLKLAGGLALVGVLAFVLFMMFQVGRMLITGGAQMLGGMGNDALTDAGADVDVAYDPTPQPTEDPMDALFGEQAYDNPSNLIDGPEETHNNIVDHDPSENLVEVPIEPMAEPTPEPTAAPEN